jgi:hypothetical protein
MVINEAATETKQSRVSSRASVAGGLVAAELALR